MAQIEPIRDALPRVISREEPVPGGWAQLRLVISRAIFWTYERGSWQYDIICAVILAFIFLTPRGWFHDGPTLELSDLRHRQGVIDIGRTKSGSEYLVDLRLVESMAPLRVEDAVASILRARLNRPVAVKSVEPVLDKNNIMLGYRVVASP